MNCGLRFGRGLCRARVGGRADVEAKFDLHVETSPLFSTYRTFDVATQRLFPCKAAFAPTTTSASVATTAAATRTVRI